MQAQESLQCKSLLQSCICCTASHIHVVCTIMHNTCIALHTLVQAHVSDAQHASLTLQPHEFCTLQVAKLQLLLDEQQAKRQRQIASLQQDLHKLQQSHQRCTSDLQACIQRNEVCGRLPLPCPDALQALFCSRRCPSCGLTVHCCPVHNPLLFCHSIWVCVMATQLLECKRQFRRFCCRN